jgi:enoyl-CoA hydratase/carnithine racemase
MHDLRLNQLVYRTEGRLARVILSRPESLNAFSLELVAELDAVSQLIENDREVRVVAITGAGRAFSAGIDLKALSRGEIDHAYLVQWERFLHRLETMDKVIVCLCHGYFIGGGLQLALACDIRVATPSAKTGIPAVKEGLIPSMGPWRLARFVGLGRARKLTLLGNLIDGNEAHQIGLVDHLVSEDSAESEFENILKEYVSCTGAASLGSKQLLTRSFDPGFDETKAYYLELQAKVMASDDLKEAQAAFRDNREPVWK